jgi:hypothetical protein
MLPSDTDELHRWSEVFIFQSALPCGFGKFLLAYAKSKNNWAGPFRAEVSRVPCTECFSPVQLSLSLKQGLKA